MSTFTVGVIVWIVAGVLAAFVLLGRQGYRDWRWYVLGAMFGPLFIPIAAERANRSVAIVEGAGPTSRSGTSIVVGVDGSTGADRAVRLAATLFDTARVRVVLVGVVDPDAADGAEDDPRRVRARAMLAERAAWFEPTAPAGHVTIEVVAGQPARALEAVAEAEGASMIVLGRRGAGLTRHVLGDVATRLGRHASVPVLLAGPPDGSRLGTAVSDDRDEPRHGTVAGPLPLPEGVDLVEKG